MPTHMSNSSDTDSDDRVSDDWQPAGRTLVWNGGAAPVLSKFFPGPNHAAPQVARWGGPVSAALLVRAGSRRAELLELDQWWAQVWLLRPTHAPEGEGGGAWDELRC